MPTIESGASVKVKNILYLTDFSKPSEVALQYAIYVWPRIRSQSTRVAYFVPEPLIYTTPGLTALAIQAEDEKAHAEMQRIDSELSGLQHVTTVERGIEVWPTVQEAIQEEDIDLVILGTHGRTGVEKLILGSAAEEIFRRSPVPVLTIGPGVPRSVHNGARFHRVLFATDFSPESLAAAPMRCRSRNKTNLILCSSP